MVFLSAGVFPVEESELYRRCGRGRRNSWGWDLGVIGRRKVEVEGEVEGEVGALDKRPLRRRVMSKMTSRVMYKRIVESRSGSGKQ